MGCRAVEMVVARFAVYFVRRLGKISDKAAGEALAVPGEMFAQ